VGCIICCLDDDEMEFLGAPWDAYLGYASCFGLDVLRLPMPEGLAPLDCAALNNHLTHIVDDYTLKGIHVLVHCRGGVGRVRPVTWGLGAILLTNNPYAGRLDCVLLDAQIGHVRPHRARSSTHPRICSPRRLSLG
jgi:hypothetical protein